MPTPRTAAAATPGTQYALTFTFNFDVGGGLREVFNNNIPLDRVTGAGGGPASTTTFDISIAKSGPAIMMAGGTGTYTIVVTNPGPTAAANATVTDNMPAGLTLLSATVQPANALALTVAPTGLVATTPSLGVGFTTLTLVVRADASAAGTTVTNVASVATTTTESTTANNSASATTQIQGLDLAIAKRGPTSLAAGATASYVLTITNSGPSTAANVTVTDVMPAGLSLVSATVVSGSFTLATSASQLVATAPTMPAGTAVISLTVNVGDAVVGTVTNVARVTSTTGDIQPSNNTATATSAVLGADIGILKFGSPSITAAGTATYTLVLFNNGASSAGNVTVTDVMPVGLTLVKAEASSASAMMLRTTPGASCGKSTM